MYKHLSNICLSLKDDISKRHAIRVCLSSDIIYSATPHIPLYFFTLLHAEFVLIYMYNLYYIILIFILESSRENSVREKIQAENFV